MAADPFDPYHKWLGIPPKDQPPHHYRLLGVEAFETDADVIENAADQRQRHIRSFQNGPNKDDSQRLLNEISAAKLCLLSPEKKAAYDAELRKRLKPKAIAKAKAIPTPTPVASAVPAAEPDLYSQLPAATAPVISTKKPISRKASPPLLPIALAVGGGVFLVLVLIVWMSLPAKTDSQPIAQSNPLPTIPIAPSQPKPDPSTLPAGVLKADPRKRVIDAKTELKEKSTEPATASIELPMVETKSVPTVASAKQPLHKVVFTRWNNGDPQYKEMSPQTLVFTGVCEVLGHFLGDGEWFSLRNNQGDNWVLGCSAARGIQVTAAAIESPWRALFEEKTELKRWNRGSLPVKLVHRNDGFALLSGAAGCFLDDAQEVRVSLDDDGYFYLDGKTNFNSQGEAMIYRYKKPGKLKIDVEQIPWTLGAPARKLIQQDEGLCFISGLGGGFHGTGERAACDLTADGHWNLAGRAGQKSMHYWVTTIKFNDPATLALVRSVGPAASGKREPVPEAAPLAAARAKLADQLASATLEQRLALANAAERTVDERYAILLDARKLAAEQGDCGWALTASDALTQAFEMAPYPTTLETLQLLRTHSRTVEANRDLCVAALRQADIAVSEGKTEFVLPLAEIAFAAARKSDAVLLRRAALLILDARRTQ